MTTAQGTPADPAKGNIDKIYDCLQNKQAPAQGGKPIYAKDFELCKHLGCKTIGDVVGHRIDETNEKSYSHPLNFGRKDSTGMLPDETRLRLLGLKKAISNCEIQAQIKYRTLMPTVAQMKSTSCYKNFLEPMLKAFNITDFSDWADTTVQARFYFEEYEIPHLLVDVFDTLPMGAAFVRVPGALGLLEGQLETDDATFTGQANTSSSYTVEAKNNVVHTIITQDLLDDSAPPLIDKLRKECQMGIVRSEEKVIINGDDSSPHQDDDTEAGSAKLFSKAYKGLRKLAFANDAVVGAGSIVYNHGGDSASKLLFASLLKLMRKQSSEKADLKWIMGTSVAHDLVTGGIPELFTAFAFGGLASNVTGQVPPVFGVNGVETQHIREDLGVDGLADNPAAGTSTCLLLVQKSRFQNWVRQATRVWAAPSLPSSDQMLMSAKKRHAFAGFPQSANERSVVMGINIETAV